MKLSGRCYCGAVQYAAEGEPLMRAQCHCRECQYITGGSVNVVLGMPLDGFRYTQGTPREFQRSDLERPVTREFCGTCGTHLATKASGLPNAVMLKVGTLDDPSVFGAPQIAVFHAEAQSYHSVPEGCAVFERFPG